MSPWACIRGEPGSTLVLAAYTAPREAFREINQRFEEKWKEKTGKKVRIKESFLSSGAQSRAVVDGFAADVVALALEVDVDRIAQAGLIQGPWRQGPNGGILAESVVAFAVRPGNPKKIRQWSDLLQEGLEVLTPNPKTSGGAQWNVLAAFGAARRGRVGNFSGDETGAYQFLT
ncbi:MAG: substrate-binding domain-containing protein, partial [bacterium]|nr:substrate-binding domain-containing protein [bacterium]